MHIIQVNNSIFLRSNPCTIPAYILAAQCELWVTILPLNVVRKIVIPSFLRESHSGGELWELPPTLFRITNACGWRNQTLCHASHWTWKSWRDGWNMSCTNTIMSSHHITKALEWKEVRVMSYITPAFEGIFSYSKIAVFSGACGTQGGPGNSETTWGRFFSDMSDVFQEKYIQIRYCPRKTYMNLVILPFMNVPLLFVTTKA